MLPSKLATLVPVLCLAVGTSAEAQLFAERITRETAERRQLGGVHAVGGIGDWALGNGTICAVVADVRHEIVLSEFGAVPADLGHCGRADDQLPHWEVILGIPAPTVQDVVTKPLEVAVETTREDAERQPPEATDFAETLVVEPTLHAEIVGDEARVVGRGFQDGVRAELRYAIGGEEPEVFRVSTRLERVEPGPKTPMFGSTIMHGNGSLRPFMVSSRPGDTSSGFDHPPVDPNDAISLALAMGSSRLFVLVGDPAIQPEISYGFELREAVLERADGSRSELPVASVSGGHFTLTLVLTRPLWLGNPERMGILELAQLPLMDIAVGDVVRIETAVLVGDRADVASVIDRVFAQPPFEAPLVSGRVGDPEVRLTCPTTAEAR